MDVATDAADLPDAGGDAAPDAAVDAADDAVPDATADAGPDATADAAADAADAAADDATVDATADVAVTADTSVDAGACAEPCAEPPSVCYADGACVDGACVYSFADGGPCFDGDVETVLDTCASGVCAGVTPGCAADGLCATDETCASCAEDCGVCVGALAWARRAGGNGADFVRDAALAPDGGILAAGSYWGPATFGPGEAGETTLGPPVNKSGFLARFESDGTLGWAVQAGNDAAYGLAATADGGAFVTGTFKLTATFGAGEPAETTLSTVGLGDTDLFLARYGADGSLVFAVAAGGPQDDEAVSVALASDGTAIVVGRFEDTITLGAGETSETTLVSDGGYDVLVAAYASDGTLAWARRAGGPEDWAEWGRRAVVAPDGTIFVAGVFGDGATFGPGEAGETTLASAGGVDAFLAALSSDGALVWVEPIGGADLDRADGVALAADGGVLVAGSFEGTATFGLGQPGEVVLSADGETDAFLARYDASGTLAWVRRVGGGGWSGASSVAAAGDGGLLMAGSFSGIATFGVGEGGERSFESLGDGWLSDAFVARFAADGSFEWARRAGGPGWDSATGVVPVSDGVVVDGFFDYTATFGAGEPGASALTAANDFRDAFLVKYTP